MGEWATCSPAGAPPPTPTLPGAFLDDTSAHARGGGGWPGGQEGLWDWPMRTCLQIKFMEGRVLEVKTGYRLTPASFRPPLRPKKTASGDPANLLEYVQRARGVGPREGGPWLASAGRSLPPPPPPPAPGATSHWAMAAAVSATRAQGSNCSVPRTWQRSARSCPWDPRAGGPGGGAYYPQTAMYRPPQKKGSGWIATIWGATSTFREAPRSDVR